jgi:tetratricopeptide (TPR) repeat protein
MNKFAGYAVLLLGSAGLYGAADAAPFSDARLAALDPTLPGRLACRGFGGSRSVLDRRLRLAQVYTEGLVAAAGSIPLVPEIAPSSLPGANLQGTARRYFDQGVAFAFGFNHAAAIRSFREAQRLAPDCALCWWGEAMANGPNINSGMDSDQNRAALAAVEQAKRLMANASPEARALIEAQALRYEPGEGADRAALDAAYADAMLAAARRFPDNDDISVLAAEAAMNTTPWDYWSDDGTPRERIAEAIALIERVMARSPDHPQAAHLYIHLMESPHPDMAEAAADRLAASGPAALGHLVHMPAHIYYRIGRYADSIRVNLAAARADEAYLAAIGDDGLYRYGYYPHNVHFLLASAQMVGDMRTVTSETARLARILDVDTAKALPWVQAIHAAPYFAAVQYASPAAILALTEGRSELAYVEAMRHYARAVAFVRNGDRPGFERALGALDRLAEAPEIMAMADAGFPASAIVALAGQVARGRQAYAAGDYRAAVAFYERALELEQAIPYNEPPFWYYPVAQSLGAALFAAGRYEDARGAFRKALFMAPNDGWALYGLARTESRLGNRLEARAAEAALDRVWQGERGWLRMDRL